MDKNAALGTEVDLGPGHIVLDGVPGLRERGTAAPTFSAHVYCGHGRPSLLLLSSCAPSGPLATIDTVRKLGICRPLLGRGAGSPSNKIVASVEAYLRTKWHLDPTSHLAATGRHMGQKLGGCAPLGEVELGPHLTQCGQGRGLSARQVSS